MIRKRKKFLKTKNDRPTDKELDRLWSDACIARDGGKCIYTYEIGRYGRTHVIDRGGICVHHILKKSTNRLRWDLDNGITVSNTKVHFPIAHSQKPIQETQFREWALGRLSRKSQDRLKMYQYAVGGLDRFALKIYLLQKICEYERQR